MGNDTCPKGEGGGGPEFFQKRYKLVHSERSEIINLKMNYFKDNTSSTTKIIRHIFVFDQSRCACK